MQSITTLTSSSLYYQARETTLALVNPIPVMSTWAASEPFRHPWFMEPSLKRKHPDSEDEDSGRDAESDQDAGPVLYPTPPPETTQAHIADGGPVELNNDRKRRRCDTIERRMAKMYINTAQGDQRMNNCGPLYGSDAYHNRVHAPPMSAAQSIASTASYYTAGSTSPVSQSSLLPQYAVEEPPSPEFQDNAALASLGVRPVEEPTIAEVRMKGAEPAWYEREKDRIVITDLDEAAEEAEEEYKSEAEPHPNASEYAETNADYSISTVLLDHIKRQSNFPFVQKSQKEKQAAGALVLFKPPPASFFTAPTEHSSSGEEKESGESDEVRVEEINASQARAFSPTGDFATGTVSNEQEDEMGEPMDMDMDVEM